MKLSSSRILRGLHALGRRVASESRKSVLRAEYPGLTFEGRVIVSPGCDIHIVSGGTLRIADCHISRGVTITVGPRAVMDIAADYIGPNAVLVARDRVTVGDGSLIAENVVVRDGNHDHSVPLREMAFTADPVEVGDDVWLGAGSTVLQGVTIGPSATVAAGAIVTRDVPAGQVAVGVPAKSRPRRE